MRLVLSLLCLFAALFAVKADTPLIGPEYTETWMLKLRLKRKRCFYPIAGQGEK